MGARAKIHDYCLSGTACENPDKHRRPTRLHGEDSESRVTGFCSHCRRAGRHTQDSARRSTERIARHEPGQGALLVNIEVHEEDEGALLKPVPLDAGEYESFTPEPEAIEPNEQNAADGAVELAPEPAVAVEAAPEETAPAPTMPAQIAKSQRVQPAPPKPRKPRKPPQKRTPQATAPEVVPAAAQPGPPGGASTQALFTEGAFPHSVAGAEAANDAPSPREEARGGAPLYSRLGKALPRVLPRPSPITVEELDDEEPELTSRHGEGALAAVGAAARRAWLGLTEGGKGAVEVAACGGRLVVGGAGLFLATGASALTIGGNLLLRRPRAAAKAISEYFQQAKKLTSLVLDPFVDGRHVPATGCLMTGAAFMLAGTQAPPIAVSALALGPVLCGGWVAYRFVRAVATGEKHFPRPVTSWFVRRISSARLRNAYKNPIWVHNSHLSPEALRELDDEMERIVAIGGEVMGFRAKVHGTQGERADGKKSTGNNDGGVDVSLVDAEGALSLVSVKRWSGKVGVDDVKLIAATARSAPFHNAQPILVTTVGFTKPALEYAKENNVQLFKLDDWIRLANRLAP